jgi:hypothetical protein
MRWVPAWCERGVERSTLMRDGLGVLAALECWRPWGVGGSNHGDKAQALC